MSRAIAAMKTISTNAPMSIIWNGCIWSFIFMATIGFEPMFALGAGLEPDALDRSATSP